MMKDPYASIGLLKFHLNAIRELERQETALYQLEAMLNISRSELIEQVQKLPYSLEDIINFVAMVGSLPFGNYTEDSLRLLISHL